MISPVHVLFSVMIPEFVSQDGRRAKRFQNDGPEPFGSARFFGCSPPCLCLVRSGSCRSIHWHADMCFQRFLQSLRLISLNCHVNPDWDILAFHRLLPEKRTRFSVACRVRSRCRVCALSLWMHLSRTGVEGRNLMTKDLTLSGIEPWPCRGRSAHVETVTMFGGLDWKVAGARPDGAPHSLFQLLNHMIYWQEWVVKWLDGKKPRPPKHAKGGWPGGVGPATRKGMGPGHAGVPQLAPGAGPAFPGERTCCHKRAV